MKTLGFYQQPKWASRPLVWVYRGDRTRKYAPTVSSRNRIARLIRNHDFFLEKVYKYPDYKISHYVLFLNSELEKRTGV